MGQPLKMQERGDLRAQFLKGRDREGRKAGAGKTTTEKSTTLSMRTRKAFWCYPEGCRSPISTRQPPIKRHG